MKKIACFLSIIALPGLAQETQPQSSAIEGVKGVKQEAAPTAKAIEPSQPKGVKQVESIEKIEGTKMPAPVPVPNAVQPVTPPPPPNGAARMVQKIEGVKAPATNAVQPVTPPPPPNGSATMVQKIEGVKAPATNAVKAVPPPPIGSAVANIRPVKGITGIVIPKQKNLEAALQIQTGGGTPNAKAAAQLGGPGEKPGPPQPGGDGRAAFQEFEKNAKGS